ncbi:hypothetical protein SAMN05660380_02294 [Xylella fastidiosa]|nr:hypothetical protein SAMN05660380_02294 [Xylella fastidiosa]
MGAEGVVDLAQVNVDAAGAEVAGGKQFATGSIDVALAGVDSDVAIECSHRIGNAGGGLGVALFTGSAGADAHTQAGAGEAAAALLAGVAGAVGVLCALQAHALGAEDVDVLISNELGADAVDSVGGGDGDVLAAQDAGEGDGIGAAGGAVAAAGTEQAAAAAGALLLVTEACFSGQQGHGAVSGSQRQVTGAAVQGHGTAGDTDIGADVDIAVAGDTGAVFGVDAGVAAVAGVPLGGVAAVGVEGAQV